MSFKKNVAFQLGNRFLLFENTGVELLSAKTSLGALLPDGMWALSDSHREFEQPCHAFMTAGGSSRAAWIVQTTSPNESKWRNWSEHKIAGMYWMDVVTLDEMIALG